MIAPHVSLDDAAVAAAAAQAGADVVRAFYGRQLTRIDKGAGDFATDADLAAEKAIGAPGVHDRKLGRLPDIRPERPVLDLP